MHELPITRDILNIALNEAKAAQAAKINTIYLVVGELSGVSSECVLFYFDFLKKGNAARAVGHALAANPFPLIIPCHRTIRSDRYPGGYQGGPAMKRALLEMEGIPFDDTGRTAGARFHYGRK